MRTLFFFFAPLGRWILVLILSIIIFYILGNLSPYPEVNGILLAPAGFVLLFSAFKVVEILRSERVYDNNDSTVIVVFLAVIAGIFFLVE